MDLSGIYRAVPSIVPPDDGSSMRDPGPLPEELLRVPGFISEVMDVCLATAPYPNPAMAFCGALALQAFLAGRKVRDPGDNRTNLYLLGLAHSSAGKDWPRKINTRILHEIGLADCLGERFATGEGIQDALFISPSMLFQTDEIDGMLQSINKAKDARHETIMSTLLTLYSCANSVFPMRRKAGKDEPGVIDQPCLVIFGTAIPQPLLRGPLRADAHQRLLRPHVDPRMRPARQGSGTGSSGPAASAYLETASGGPTSGPAPATWRTGIPGRWSYRTPRGPPDPDAAARKRPKPNTPRPRSTTIRWARPSGAA